MSAALRSAVIDIGYLPKLVADPALGGDIENPDWMHLAAFHFADSDEDPA